MDTITIEMCVYIVSYIYSYYIISAAYNPKLHVYYSHMTRGSE